MAENTKYLPLLLCMVANSAAAVELEQSVDLSLTFTPNWQPKTEVLEDDTVGKPYELEGQADVFWNLNAYLTQSVTFHFRYGLSSVAELDREGAASNIGAGDDFRLDDLPSDIEPEYHQSLDRLNINYYTRYGDFTIGRQAISFGQAKFFSPIDVIYPKKLFEIESDYRPGVDAVRATWPMGATSELEYGYLAGDERGHFLRYKTFLLNTDWELIGIDLSDNNLILSLGANGGVSAIGLWQETALLVDREPEKQYVRATVGADYTFFDDLYVAFETHYNGVGESDHYILNAAKSFYQSGIVFPQGKWYSSMQASYPINILTQIGAGATTNLNDFSSLLNSTLTFNATDALTVNVSLLIPVAQARTFEYEYGIYPYTGIVDLEWVF